MILITLLEAYQKVNYSSASPLVQPLLGEIELINFNRSRSGKIQTFTFTFTFKGEKYVLEHSFLYTSVDVEHQFKYKNRGFFSSKPFQLSNSGYQQLSQELMRAVNHWNKIQKNPE